MSTPSIRTVPADGVSSPARSASSVDLPEPETPTTAIDSPPRTAKLTPSSMVSRASPVLTCLPRPAASITMGATELLRIAIRCATACALALWAVAAGAATILVYGDSLSAGYGIGSGKDWASLLAARLKERRLDYRVANASVSGETTFGGRSRFAAALKTHQPALVILALGANDGLRGTDLGVMRANLEAMVDAARGSGAGVLLVGMRLPPNYGAAYTEKFRHVYPAVAASRKVALVPFLFEGFAASREYFQEDNVHPNARAQPLILETVWRRLEPLLKR